MHTWYVTFEANEQGISKRRRQPLITRTFESESEAKLFAREKFREGLTVFAGTINPHSPKRLISSADISSWIEALNGPQRASTHE
jgi:hypothetical protein